MNRLLRFLQQRAWGAATAAEQERCATIADSYAAEVTAAPVETRELIDRQDGLTYTTGYAIAASRIAAKIRTGKDR